MEGNEPLPPPKWEDLPLSPESMEAIRNAGLLQPTPVQVQALPQAMEGKNLIVSSQTGTGKTLAFTLPLIERLAGRSGTFAIILAPTREIALQIHAVIEQFGKARGVSSIALIGGIDLKQDDVSLNLYPSIIVGTPGRICDHIGRGNLWLEFIEHVVLDEADRMLDMGFAKQLNQILDEIPDTAQFLLFSATIPPDVENLAKKFLGRGTTKVSIGRTMTAASTVEQRIIWMKEEDKNRALRRLFEEEKGTIIVFVRTKDGASKIWRRIHSWGIYDATAIHSDLSQPHREKALQEFKDREKRILIATDVVGRGIHVDAVSHVINYDLPMEPEDYVHRIGRTGRAEASGRATSFATPRDRKIVERIEKMLKMKIQEVGAPAKERAESSAPKARGPVEIAPVPTNGASITPVPARSVATRAIPTSTQPLPLRPSFAFSKEGSGLSPFSPDDLAGPYMQDTHPSTRMKPQPQKRGRSSPGRNGRAPSRRAKRK